MNIRNSEFSLIKKHLGLTFRRALYQFPNTKIAILDENGDIVAANPLWISGLPNGSFDTDNSPRLGANYFDICRHSLAQDDANSLIIGMKKVISGAAPTFLSCHRRMDYTAHTETHFSLFACPISDSPNSILVAYEDVRAATHQEQHIFQDVMPSFNVDNRDFA